jgi:hypothetical protein
MREAIRAASLRRRQSIHSVAAPQAFVGLSESQAGARTLLTTQLAPGEKRKLESLIGENGSW